MRICPHCGNQIPDDDNTIYCPVCNHIADEQVLLRMKIEKKLQKPEKKPEPVKKSTKKPDKKVAVRRKYDGDTVGVSDHKNPYLSTIISIVVVAAVIAAVFYFFR